MGRLAGRPGFPLAIAASYGVPGTFSFLCRSGPNSANMPIGNMGGCPPISRPIWEFWTFRKQGPWDKGLARPCPPGSSLPATHCRAGQGKESKKFFHVSASQHQICHPRHWCPMATVQQFWGEPNKFSAPYTGMFSEMLLRVVKWPNRMQTRCSVSDTVQTRWSIVVDHYHDTWQVSSESIEK